MIEPRQHPKHPRARKQNRQIEHGVQRGLFDWRAWRQKQIPALRLLHAVPNGGALTGQTITLPNGKKKRRSLQAVKLKREGLTPGTLDCHWPVARGCYHGLFIEHKSGPDKHLSDDQSKFAHAAREEGNYVAVSYSSDYSIALIEAYNALGPYDARGPMMPDVFADHDTLASSTSAKMRREIAEAIVEAGRKAPDLKRPYRPPLPA